MSRRIITVAPWALCALCATIADAQSDPALSAHNTAPHSAAASGDFGDLVNQDVANGYYSKGQGDALKGRFEAAQEHINASFARADAQINRDASLFASSDQQQTLINQAGSGNALGTPDGVHQTAESTYNLVDRSIQLKRLAIQAVQPAIQESAKEIDELLSERAQLISSNPNVPAPVKHDVNSQSAKVHEFADGVERKIDAEVAQITADQDRFESNKGPFVQQVETKVQEYVDNYGTDQTKWPKPASPPQPGAPPPQEARNEPPPAQPPASDEPPPPPARPIPPHQPPITRPLPVDHTNEDFNGHRNDPGGGTGKGTQPSDDGGAIGAGIGDAASAATQLRSQANRTGTPQSPPPDPVGDFLRNPKSKLPEQVFGSGKGKDDKISLDSAGNRPSDPLLDDLRHPPPPDQGSSGSIGSAASAAAGAQFGQPGQDHSGSGSAAAGSAIGGASGTQFEGEGSSSADSAGGTAGAVFNGAKDGKGGKGTETPEDVIFRNNRPGNLRLVEGDQYAPDLSHIVLPQLKLTADELQSIEYGDTITTASLLPIYAGYKLSDHTGDAMMSLDLHPPTPSSLLTVPSLQFQVPSSVVPFGTPSSTILPTLCGR